MMTALRIPARRKNVAKLLLACAAVGPSAEAAVAAPQPTREQIEAHYTPALQTCLNSGDAAIGVSVAMGACVHIELAVQDERLNTAYRTAMRSLGKAGQARLRAEERGWIKRRDVDCDAVAMGGTIDLVDVPTCRLDETIRRRIVLEAFSR